MPRCATSHRGPLFSFRCRRCRRDRMHRRAQPRTSRSCGAPLVGRRNVTQSLDHSMRMLLRDCGSPARDRHVVVAARNTLTSTCGCNLRGSVHRVLPRTHLCMRLCPALSPPRHRMSRHDLQPAGAALPPAARAASQRHCHARFYRSLTFGAAALGDAIATMPHIPWQLAGAPAGADGAEKLMHIYNFCAEPSATLSGLLIALVSSGKRCTPFAPLRHFTQRPTVQLPVPALPARPHASPRAAQDVTFVWRAARRTAQCDAVLGPLCAHSAVRLRQTFTRSQCCSGNSQAHSHLHVACTLRGSVHRVLPRTHLCMRLCPSSVTDAPPHVAATTCSLRAQHCLQLHAQRHNATVTLASTDP